MNKKVWKAVFVAAVIMMKTCVLGIMTLFLVSCQDEKKEIERIGDISFSVVSDSIYSRMPGKIFYQNDILFWHDAVSSENIIHALDVTTGDEIVSFGNIGMGPKEFVRPMLSLSPRNGLYLNDLEKGLQALAQIDNDPDSLRVHYQSFGKEELVTSLLHISDDDVLYFKPDKSEPFELCVDGIKYQAGRWPIQEDIINGFDVFQGALGYNSQNSCLVYSTYSFPYTAVYRLQNGKISLLKEMKTDIDYSVVQNELKLGKGNSKGLTELALTKENIVMLQRDIEVEGELPKPKSPRDISTLPRSLFVYDYDLNLKKIINMPFPLLRLCGDANSDCVYAVAINPEYMIIKIDLK